MHDHNVCNAQTMTLHLGSAIKLKLQAHCIWGKAFHPKQVQFHEVTVKDWSRNQTFSFLLLSTFRSVLSIHRLLFLLFPHYASSLLHES